MTIIGIIRFILLNTILTSSYVYAYKISDYEKFKTHSDCAKCDLTEVSFPHDVSNLNFEDSFFTKSELYSTKANQTVFSNSNFVYSYSTSSEFRNSKFIDAHLNYSKFYESSFDGADFTNANMSFSNFSGSHFVNADFTNANLKGANFTNTNLYNSNITTQQLKSLESYKCAILPNGDLFDNDGQYDCHLINFNFDAENKKIKQIQIIDPLLNQMGSEADLNNFLKTKECIYCDLSNSILCRYITENLSSSNIDSSDLHNIRVTWCDMSYSNFTNSFIYSSNFVNAVLLKVNFQHSRLDYSSLTLSHLSEASFSNTSLKKVDFSSANLSSADFTGANTKGVKFTKAILIGSNITKNQLEEADNIACSVLPNGEVVDAGSECR